MKSYQVHPNISLVSPILNQAPFLEATIQSVLNQEYPNLEYLIIDGGSTDGTLEIIKKYEPQLTYWESQQDNGQAHAINKGWQRATGEIVGWLNSDDLLYPGALEKVGRFFAQNPNVDFIHGHCIQFDDQRGDWVEPKDFTPTSELDPYKLKLDYLAGFPYGQPACFFRKRVLDQIGMLDEDYFFTMDYDLFIRIALNFKMQRIDDILAKFRVHPASKSANYQHIRIKERNKAFSKLVRTIIALEEGQPATSHELPATTQPPNSQKPNTPIPQYANTTQQPNDQHPNTPIRQYANTPTPHPPNHPTPNTQQPIPPSPQPPNHPIRQRANTPPHPHPYLHLLKSLNLYHESTDTYPIINCQYSQEEFRDVVANFLWIKAFEHHKHLRIAESKPLFKALGKFAPDFLKRYDNQHLYLKNRWLNKPLIESFRNARFMMQKLLKTKFKSILFFKTFY